MKERSLVLFTLLMQTAVGAYLVPVGLMLWFGDSISDLDTILLFRVVFWLVMGLSILGLLASFLHLGSIRNAWYALSNLRSSWLSREIFFALLFTLGVSLFNLFGANTGTRLAIAVLYVLTGIAGLALVVSMSYIYRLRTVPHWNTPATERYFWTTTFLLGGLTSVTSFYLTVQYLINFQADLPMLAKLEWKKELVTLITPLACFLVILVLIQLWLSSNRMAQTSLTKEKFPSKKKSILTNHRWWLALGGSGILISILLLLNPSSNIGTITSLVVVSWFCVLTGEVLWRIAFYEARKQPGLVYPELPWNSSIQG